MINSPKCELIESTNIKNITIARLLRSRRYTYCTCSKVLVPYRMFGALNTPKLHRLCEDCAFELDYIPNQRFREQPWR